MRFFYVVQLFRLARMPIVIGVLPSFFLGSLFALVKDTEFLAVNFLWGFLILFLIEIAAAYANDYFDYGGDTYNKQFGFSGGSGVLLEYPQLRPVAKWAAVFLFVLAFILTVLMVWYLDFPLWVVAYITVAALFCWFYTAPPIKLAYRGLGELPHMLAGIMFPGWGYLILTGTLDWNLLIFALPLGFAGLTVIFNFEIPDREADQNAGKHNLIVTRGRRFAFHLVFMLYLLITLYFLGLAVTGWWIDHINFYVIALMSSAPLGVSLMAVVRPTENKEGATRYAIRTAVSHFISTFVITGYFIYLIL